jgi:hypothetical protein
MILEFNRIENVLNEKNSELLVLYATFQNSTDYTLESFIYKLKQFYERFIKFENEIGNVFNHCKNVTPFKMRSQKLSYPNNKCLCATTYQTDHVRFRLLILLIVKCLDLILIFPKDFDR